jgi:hypothetical protein
LTRVLKNYRITFGWSGEDALDVDFEDYEYGRSYEEKERTAARPSGRNYQGKHPAVCRRVPLNASRHSGSAQDRVARIAPLKPVEEVWA